MSEPAPPVRKDVARNRARIVASAHRVFRAHGTAATLDEIAADAGLGVGTVYRHFPRKQNLIEAMFAERLEVVVAMAERALEADDPWQGFADFCHAAAREFSTDRGLYDVMLSNQLGGHDVAAARAKVLPLCERIVTRAQESGQLRSDFTATEFPLLHLMIGSVADYTQTFPTAVWPRYLAIFLDGLRADRPQDPLPAPAPDEEAVENAARQWRPHRPGPS